MFQVTTALRKMLRMTARKKVVQGATYSGKTYGIIPILYDKCLERPRIKCTVVAETLPAVKDGALDIFKNWMQDEGRWVDYRWNASSLIYTLGNGSKIQFKSFDTVGKAKAAGKRDILFINEANHIPFQIADTLMIRSQEVWLDFNADNEFWAHTEVLASPDSELLKLTYLDNEAIPAATLQEMMHKKSKADAEDAAGNRGYWWNWWQVYGLGEIGKLTGAVFSNWKIVDDIPKDARLVAYGLDFGYSNDPTALTAIYYMDGKYYLDEVVYSNGLLISELAALMKSKGVDRGAWIYADSAEPRSIRELKGHGFRVKEATKGADSIVYGIEQMQECEFLITSRSLNVIKEFRNYLWQEDRRTGMTINKPIDDYNHAIDGIRYYFLSKKTQSRKYYAA